MAKHCVIKLMMEYFKSQATQTEQLLSLWIIPFL